MAFQRLEWRIQRVGWFLMALVVAAALLGFLGAGPFSSATRSKSSLNVEYERFLHYQAPSYYRVHLDEPAQTKMRLGQSFLSSVRLNQIVPRPLKMEFTRDGVIVHFGADNAIQKEITIPFEPEVIGLLRAELASPGEPPLRLTQFVYP